MLQNLDTSLCTYVKCHVLFRCLDIDVSILEKALLLRPLLHELLIQDVKGDVLMIVAVCQDICGNHIAHVFEEFVLLQFLEHLNWIFIECFLEAFPVVFVFFEHLFSICLKTVNGGFLAAVDQQLNDIFLKVLYVHSLCHLFGVHIHKDLDSVARIHTHHRHDWNLVSFRVSR